MAMMDKRLIGLVPESKRYIAGNVACQWVSLAANIVLMAAVAQMLEALWLGSLTSGRLVGALSVALACVAVRFACSILASRMGYLSSKAVKRTLREKIYGKLLRLGASYKERVSTSEVVQVAVEGVDQLETYFGAYLPQFFYAMLAPLTLFAVLSFVSFPSAIVLFVCVPLIPVTIVAVQRWAKKLLSRYWGRYTALGDTFLENLQGLTTTKIYQSDGFKHAEMNAQSEEFRKITMKVLTMQLNSITIMDTIAYGGAALGVILAVTQMAAGHVGLAGCLMIILLAADFFLPMRMLGSYFHIAMNGMAASDKIFALLALPEPGQGTRAVPDDCSISVDDLHFSYDGEREVLAGVSAEFPAGGFTAVVGESGCGKSTLAGILMGRNRGYAGEVRIGGVALADIAEADLFAHITYVGHASHLFKGTVRENLLMARPSAPDEVLWSMLEQVRLAAFFRGEDGLDTELAEGAANLSGGQRQRLALARALLHDTPIYIFDEATSNIDVESETDIMARIHELAKTRTVILISHRLANVMDADRIYVMDAGRVVESGTHGELLAADGAYAGLWRTQQELERYVGPAQNHGKASVFLPYSGAAEGGDAR